MSSNKEIAIKLRREGKTYSEILAIVPVAKSTLSLWLREVGLSKAQTQQLTAKKVAAQKRGAQARRSQRIDLMQTVFTAAKKDVGSLTKRELWLVGTALYWAEGSKELSTTPSQGVDFGNTDSEMIKLFLRYLHECLDVATDEVSFSLYIHESHKHRVDEVIKYWRKQLSLDTLAVTYIYFKKHNPKTVRKNISTNYHGTLRLRVKKSSLLQRKISGWIYGITGANWRIV